MKLTLLAAQEVEYHVHAELLLLSGTLKLIEAKSTLYTYILRQLPRSRVVVACEYCGPI